MDSVEIDSDIEALVCPRCKDSLLHHGEVRVLSRPKEDGPGTSITVGPDLELTQKRIAADEFSGRRGEILIDFCCEQCDQDRAGAWIAGLTLRIQQHKGCSYLSWVRVATPVDPTG